MNHCFERVWDSGRAKRNEPVSCVGSSWAPVRLMVDALRYVCRTGCQWRSLPACFPLWSAVYYYFARWQTTGTLQRLNEARNRADRLAGNRLLTPSLALVDAQSVKLAPRTPRRAARP
jgi:transposase